MNQMENNKITKCSNGHYFSAAKYDSCPYCNPNSNAVKEERFEDDAGKTQPLDVLSNGATVPIDDIHSNSRTVPAEKSTNEDKEAKTVGIFASKAESGREPVVGWLVCIDGKHKGQDFRLKNGKNFIGRGSNMDVVLSLDTSVSRDKHSIVVYEPKSKMFIIQSGDSRELSYLNDDIILEPKVLKSFDKITLGASTLMFIPLCGENFDW